MSAIAEGISRSYKESSDEEKQRIKENVIKYIVNQSKTSGHKVKEWEYARIFELLISISVLEICIWLRVLSVPQLCQLCHQHHPLSCLSVQEIPRHWLDSDGGARCKVLEANIPQVKDPKDITKHLTYQFMSFVFNRLTMCIWRQFGDGGKLETSNHLCLLATNTIIEKIFVFLWFWLIFLLLASFINFAYYSILIFCKNDYVRCERLDLDTDSN